MPSQAALSPEMDRNLGVAFRMCKRRRVQNSYLTGKRARGLLGGLRLVQKRWNVAVPTRGKSAALPTE